MKLDIKTLFIAPIAILALLAGCSNAAANPGETVGLANPWTESDQQGVLEATGFIMEAPKGAADVRYSYMAEGKLAQMRYVLDGAEWVYRIQSALEPTDISGMEYEWTSKEEGTVSGRDAVYYAWSNAKPDSQTVDNVSYVQVVNWYDAVAGVMYSLSASGQDLNGMDLQVYAEDLYVPLQGDA